MAPDVTANLKRFREEKQLTQEQMAKKLGYSVYGYRKIEQGQRKLTVNLVMKIVEILECSIEEIFLP